jgi:methionyl-tRNA formyltransferase
MKDAKALRIVFMGTPGFAVASLDALVKNGFNVVAVITAPDKPAGRGQQVQQSEVKQYAVAQNLRVLQPEKLKAESFIEELRALQVDLQIVVAFRMLPEVVWNMPPMGTFNLHASLLPRYRGAAPINWAVINGDQKTGVTTFFLQHEIDTGNIAFREEVLIGENDTAGMVHDRLMDVGASLVLKTVEAVACGTCPKIPQEEIMMADDLTHHAPKIFRETCRIDWSQSGVAIHNLVRGMSPHPAAWTEWHTTTGNAVVWKIFKTHFELGTHTEALGTLLAGLRVAVKDGWIVIEELQAAGKKRMGAVDYLRGARVGAGERLS